MFISVSEHHKSTVFNNIDISLAAAKSPATKIAKKQQLRT